MKPISQECINFPIICNDGDIPQSMADSILVRLPKKPNATECSQHRTISLMSHVLKLVLRMVLKRNKHEIEVDEFQSGFMSGKGTREGIFNMITICEQYTQMGKKV